MRSWRRCRRRPPGSIAGALELGDARECSARTAGRRCGASGVYCASTRKTDSISTPGGNSGLAHRRTSAGWAAGCCARTVRCAPHGHRDTRPSGCRSPGSPCSPWLAVACLLRVEPSPDRRWWRRVSPWACQAVTASRTSSRSSSGPGWSHLRRRGDDVVAVRHATALRGWLAGRWTQRARCWGPTPCCTITPTSSPSRAPNPGCVIPAGVTEIIVEGRDRANGYGGTGHDRRGARSHRHCAREPPAWRARWSSWPCSRVDIDRRADRLGQQTTGMPTSVWRWSRRHCPGRPGSTSSTLSPT